MSGKAKSNRTSQEITHSNVHRNVTLSPILSQTNQWVWFGFLLRTLCQYFYTLCFHCVKTYLSFGQWGVLTSLDILTFIIKD